MGALVSVIVPAFNHANFIGAALESALQRNRTDMELVIVDDCSTDGTFEKAREFLDRAETACLRRTVLLRNERNEGAAAGINKGLKAAQGQWLTILNSDDCYGPQRIDLMLEALTNQGGQYGFSGLVPIDSKGNPIKHHPLAMSFLCLQDRIEAWGGAGFAILNENIAHSTGNLFFSRAIWEKVGDFANLALAHDWDYLMRLLAIADPVFLPQPLYSYRLHENNTYVKLEEKRYFDIAVVYARYLRTLANGNFENPNYPLYGTRQNSRRLEYFKNLTETPVDYVALARALHYETL